MIRRKMAGKSRDFFPYPAMVFCHVSLQIGPEVDLLDGANTSKRQESGYNG